MDIFDRLPKEDVELLNRYINYYGGSDEKESYMELSNMPYFLRFWKVNKMPFFKMLTMLPMKTLRKYWRK